jgi:DNA modification methylase
MNSNTIQNQLPVNTILNGNCIQKMRLISANSIDFMVTDPPYLVNYHDRNARSIENDTNAHWLRPAMREAYRVLKQDRVAIILYGWTRVDAFFPAWKMQAFVHWVISSFGRLFFKHRLSQLSARAGIPAG